MKLESALKHFHPKTPTFSDASTSTAPDRMKGMDTAAALGMAGSQAKFGMAAFFAKNDVSEEDKFSTVEELTRYARRTVPKLISKAAGNKLGPCLVILSKMAFEDYARSAASTCQCSECRGKGLIYGMKEVEKHPGIIRADGVVIIAPWIEKEQVGELCQKCNGKGVLSSRCRCKGRGVVVDEEKTALQGVPVDKICPRCSGRGYSRVPSSVAYTAIKALVPALTQSSWSRNWKPFYEKLVSKCYAEESRAEVMFSKVTK
ncbi:antitermination protein [Xenorhabdus bovienii]|uniref:antitermination protein n=1 Tax=Xenorhabdus bovienii TaxID=40576 RepID=UPI0023B2CAFD|nr:antitermination protein [Xenorhabdus bovienii]MDE9463637.1 antitermination protein [Xenorhabdus bovienii]MDE9471216.1 antitermination protein [Xenorhabdus bovienii]